MTIGGISDRFIIGLLVVALGVMFLLDTTNTLGQDTNIVGTYWPALLIAWGLWGLVSSGFVLKFWSIAVLAVGVVFLLSNLNLWTWDIGQLWPIALVLVGLALLLGGRVHRRGWRGGPGRGFQRPGRPTRRGGIADSFGNSHGQEDSGGSVFRASHIFGGGEERITSQDFRGGEVASIFGGMEIDLRNAGLAEGKATIDATVICGGLELQVPRDWRVSVQTTTLFGGVENRHPQPDPQDTRGELTLTGTVLFGGIEVRD
jgi:hypothetical protein